jgi:putative transposase
MTKEFEWRTGRSCVFRTFYHLVFVTKYRRTALTSDMLKRLEEIFKETMQQMDGELLEFGGEGDHVHIMISAHPKNAMSAIVSKLKGKSSYLLRREFWTDIKKKLWGKHFWSPSYCIVSCGGAPLDIVKAYIANQQRPEDPKHIAQSKRLTGVKRNADINR